MRTIVILKKSILISAIVLLGIGGTIQAKHRHIYRVPARPIGFTVINQSSPLVTTVQRFTQKDRWNMVVAYLGTHTYLSAKDYAKLTGLKKAVAEAELEAFSVDKKKKLSIIFIKKKKVYTLNG